MSTRKKATLVLQNGRKMEGWSFGYDGPCEGEVLFSTAMDFNVPLITNSRLATAYIRAFCAVGQDEIGIKSWDEY